MSDKVFMPDGTYRMTIDGVLGKGEQNSCTDAMRKYLADLSVTSRKQLVSHFANRTHCKKAIWFIKSVWSATLEPIAAIGLPEKIFKYMCWRDSPDEYFRRFFNEEDASWMRQSEFKEMTLMDHWMQSAVIILITKNIQGKNILQVTSMPLSTAAELLVASYYVCNECDEVLVFKTHEDAHQLREWTIYRDYDRDYGIYFCPVCSIDKAVQPINIYYPQLHRDADNSNRIKLY